ncbi:protein of unknown function DUF59 [Pseudopedobacter saltans DSM 12145]|uniref:MIP18 family-like domain-containing protein n=1 Tax=Pseudopedobacter saltans (strain ATCC 51119 / DSM 12145 / JCM 21818 / CCUG 39354 / LMG 10337 / NBRC 100064 / NCIMB 13643) TaxID=762903 RepID=F0S4Z0_PSESL|nr:metal-sulfur cluster assembly factor [Pseudopedobacter saltans]ADY54164.1 protein of unknown function DUF59 [Pseudopedobacter saltans DSM 12145]
MIVSLTDPYSAEKIKAQQALFKVIDPELFVNVVDLGLIYNVAFDKDDLIEVTMTLSTPHCPMGEAITNGVHNALEAVFPDRKVVIDLVFDPPWGYDMLTPEGKEQLGV